MGAHGQLIRGSNGLSPGTKYKRSKNVHAVTSIAYTDVHLCTELLQLPAQTLIGSPGTLLPTILPGNSSSPCSTHFSGVRTRRAQHDSSTRTKRLSASMPNV